MAMVIRLMLLVLAAVGAAAGAHAQRQAVLGQIDAPHPYYYRELYLPQLTAGPSALTWSADGKQLIYAMQGSLWRQGLDGGPAVQLTAGAGYDYQPDASPDGRWVIYSRYQDAAVELRVLDLSSGQSQTLLSDGSINVEPRFSPDGSRVVFVSTRYHKRFHVFVAGFAEGRLGDLKRLTGENRSELPRYYYSPFDHEISPVWSRDGRDIVFVSNRNHLYGTGGLWRVPADAGVAPDAPGMAGGAAREIHYEETNWKARPDLSPDGGRVVFSSYLGRSWNNLWLMPAQGGDVFPIAYGDYDQTGPRWSPDGARIAFISNRDGGTAIGLVGVPGGHIEMLPLATRQYIKPMARLELQLTDGQAPGSARISVTGGDGKFYAPADAWIHADDGLDRRQSAFEAHYFHAHGTTVLDVPAGSVRVDVMHGFERRFEQREVQAVAGQTMRLAVDLSSQTLRVPDPARWASADVHVHMNYGGTYRNTPAHLAVQAEAEHLDFVNSLIVNKEQRFPDIAYNGRQRDPASTPRALIVHGQEYHTSYWGHLGLLGIQDLILPGYVGYPNTAAASLSPMNADVADLAHARGALVGYVHPYDEYPEPVRRPHEVLTSELPVDVALGKVDYMEILGFADHRSTAAVWYQLLNLGFRIPAAGGTDAMANYASLRGPVGMNRTFARVAPEGLQAADWYAALKAGRTFATNGPLLGLSLDQAGIGDTLTLGAASPAVRFSARLESLVPVDRLELVCNGVVRKSFGSAKGLTQGEFTGTLALKDSGWCVLRASSNGARYPVLDNYVYATTSPIYVQRAGQPVRSPADARYFVAWIERMIETTAAYPDWNSAAEREGALQRLEAAKATFTAME